MNSTPPRLIVGVGASAGGLDALKRLLVALPKEGDATYLLVQHPAPKHERPLIELLAPYANVEIQRAEEGLRLRPNTIYIVPAESIVTVRDSCIQLETPPRERNARHAVDQLFRTLALAFGRRSVGIVLSGTGTDGALGLREIKEAGGLTIVQDPDSSERPEMPQSAIDTGIIDLILPVESVPAALDRFANLLQHPVPDPEKDEALTRPPTVTDEALMTLAALLDARLNFDLRVYKPATVVRRLVRRMALSGFEDTSSYFERLRQDPKEQHLLVRDFLITVTDFYRDPPAFRVLRERIIDPLVAAADTDATLRIWVPACATGEEAYSIAMEFLDSIQSQSKQVNVQLFATDIDQEALSFARAATYPPSIVEHIPEERLRSYFTRLEGIGYQARAVLRGIVSFAAHDLTKDPPFSRMHLVSCRNVLIYLTPEAQEHVLHVLHFALQADGYLFLSTSESVGTKKELFSTVSKSQRIYKKEGKSRPITLARSRAQSPQEQDAGPTSSNRALSLRYRWGPSRHDLARRTVLEAWAPPTLIVGDDGSILFLHGELGPYLRFPQGDNPRLEFASLLKPEIATRTRGAMYKCRRRGEVVEALSSPDGTRSERVRIIAKPAPALGDGAVMISFQSVLESTFAPPERPENRSEEAMLEQLERELQATREDLRNTVEELETSNEELRSSNEESMSMNEELQSTNEELEATTEELRSLNEELSTVNAQLREKIEQLEQAHDDLNNFFSSTKVATIFLDEQLCIKRFTPAAKELLGLDQADIGRRIVNIAGDMLHKGLDREAQTVLEHLSPSASELRTKDGRWVARHVLPYRTESRRIEGVVVTFVDITDLKSTTERLLLREQQQRVIARIGLHALREADLQGFMAQAVRDVQQTLNTDFCKILELQPDKQKLLLRAGVGWQPGLVGLAYVPTGSDSQAGYTLRSPEPVIVENMATERRFSGPELLTDHGVTSGISCVIRDGDHDYGVIGAHTTAHRVFSREDANFLQAVASVLGAAISRYQARLRVALELGVAHVLSEAADLDLAMPQLLHRLTSDIGACVAELWWFDANGQLQRRWEHDGRRRSSPPPPVQAARRERRDARIVADRVAAEARAIWWTDIGTPPSMQGFERPPLETSEFVSGFGFPVYGDNMVKGSVVLLSMSRLFGDDVFLRSLEAVGRSIGDFLSRSEFEQRARRLAAITESSHDAILSYTLDGRITEWLVGAERLFGYSTEEMRKATIERIVPHELREELWSINTRIRQGEVVEPFETTRIRKDGQRIDVSVRSSPVRDRNGKVIGISSTDRDITRQKATERKLVEADRQKDEFLAMLGHELRNPLAAIRSASELLKHRVDDDSNLQRMQAVLERQTTHMAKLLDGLLDVSRIIRGRIRLEREVVDLVTICRQVLSDVEERLPQRSLNLQAIVPDEPVWVNGDPVRLAQIIDNLLSNAVKYTQDSGSILLIVEEAAGNAVVRLRDTGVGIEPELLPYVFEVFRQSEQNLDRSYGGLGLGLALVKALAELHGGSVEATSEGKNKGSEFVVHLPSTTREALEDAPPTKRPQHSLTILLIEDNEDAAEMLSQVLELSGHQVRIAAHGRAGVDLAKELRPDLILCDLGLPDGMSGFDVARELRANESTSPIPLIALSGYGRPEDKQRGKQAGFDAHITKPVDVKALKTLLATLTARMDSASQAHGSA